MAGSRWMRCAGWLLCVLVLAACASGPVRRVSEPTMRIQQLSVDAAGNWSVELRLDNFSSLPMRFDSLELTMTVAEQEAGRLQARPGLTIGPESADVVGIRVMPTTAGKLAVADALAGRRGLGYKLEGTITATPEDERQREFRVRRSSALSPAPGLPGVLR